MPRRRRAEHAANHERWLVSYADLITLLFAFFVILYAISSADAQKLKAANESMKKAFGAEGAKRLSPAADAPPSVEAPSSALPKESPQMKQIASQLESALSAELEKRGASEKIEVAVEDRGVVVRLSATDIYDSGAAFVRAAELPVLDEMARVLKPLKRRVRVEGHTDDLKTTSRDYPSNWELSTARAAWIVRYFIQRWEFDPLMLEASGYAEFHPLTDNASEQGRSRNRRIEVVVLKD